MTAICRGQIARVEFLDHIQGGEDPGPYRFCVYGEVVSVTRLSISIDAWAYADRREPHDENEMRYTIVRSAITKITRLVPATPEINHEGTKEESMRGNQ